MGERLTRRTKFLYGIGDTSFSLSLTILNVYFAILWTRFCSFGCGRQRGYAWMDLSLTSADNPRTPGLAARMGAKVYKRYRVYQMTL